MMNKNESYKDSGVEWIGEIPKHWEMSKIKYISDVETGSTPKSKFMSYWNGKIRWYTPIDFKSVGKKRFLGPPARFITQEGLSNSACSFIDKDAVLLTTRAPVGNVGKIKKNFTFNQGCKSLTPGANLDISYLYFYLKTVTEPLNVIANGTTFTELSIQNLLNFEIPMPPREEQKIISRYLDKRTEQIDSLIEKLQKKIELLKEQQTSLINQFITKGIALNIEMKDSGIEWVGIVPKHWKLIKLRYLCDITTGGKNTEDNIEDGDYPFFVRSPKIERINSWSFDGEAVLTAGDGAVGKIFHHYIGKFDFHQRVYKFSNFQLVLGRYFYWFLRENFQHEILRWNAKTTVDSVRLPFLQNFPMVIPPIDEQKRILERVENLSDCVDKSVFKMKRKIDLLKEYRQSLIFSIVTGKTRITENMT